MGIINEIYVLVRILERAIQEENTNLEQVIPFCENGTEHIKDRIGINGEMIANLTKFVAGRK